MGRKTVTVARSRVWHLRRPQKIDHLGTRERRVNPTIVRFFFFVVAVLVRPRYMYNDPRFNCHLRFVQCERVAGLRVATEFLCRREILIKFQG